MRQEQLLHGWFGYVSKVEDEKKFIIRATVEGVVKDILATPWNQKDEPNVGDPIVLVGFDTVFGYCYIYQKLKLKDHIRFKIGEVCIDLDGDGENAVPGTMTLKTAGAKITIDEGGNIKVEQDANWDQKTSGNQKVEVSGNYDVKASGNINIEASVNCTVKAPKVQITGGQCTINGSVSPTGNGALCGIPMCLFTGAPHSGPTASGT